VTESVVLWLVWLVGCVFASVFGFGEFPSHVLVTVISVVLSLVMWALVGWAVGRGSATARIVLVVVAVARALLSLGNSASTLLLVVLPAVAAVRLFLSTAHPFSTRR
jgi:hypothetical protein